MILFKAKNHKRKIKGSGDELFVELFQLVYFLGQEKGFKDMILEHFTYNTDKQKELRNSFESIFTACENFIKKSDECIEFAVKENCKENEVKDLAVGQNDTREK